MRLFSLSTALDTCYAWKAMVESPVSSPDFIHPRWILELCGWAKGCLDTDTFPLWILQFCPVLPGTRVQPEWILHFSLIGLYLSVKLTCSFQSVIKMKCNKGGKHCGENSSSSPKREGRLYFLLAFPYHKFDPSSSISKWITLDLTKKWNARSSRRAFLSLNVFLL